MYMLESQSKERSNHLKKIGVNFLGILNDIKRRPEDAARELDTSLEEITQIIDGKKILSQEIIEKATKIWPVNARDFHVIYDDCSLGVKIMTSEESEKSSRIMERAGNPYYEYRDTAMSKVAPFRPEWIKELCYVDNNDPQNSSVQWNNGHFMHQFTYFVGDVNFYYQGSDGKKTMSAMKTGDSMYITPFVSHSFASRSGAKQNGLILALTYGSKITGDVQQELSALSNLGQEFALNFTDIEHASASLLKYHRNISSLTYQELSKRSEISVEKLQDFENAILIPTEKELTAISHSLNVSKRDLMPNDKTEQKVIVKFQNECKRWFHPEGSMVYEFVELASTSTMPYSKAFEIHVQNSEPSIYNLRVGLHQFVYNIGEHHISLNWEFHGESHQQTIKPGDSAYLKPFINHNFSGKGKILVLRVGGKIAGDSQRELSIIGKKNAKRAINETMQWFAPKSRD